MASNRKPHVRLPLDPKLKDYKLNSTGSSKAISYTTPWTYPEVLNLLKVKDIFDDYQDVRGHVTDEQRAVYDHFITIGMVDTSLSEPALIFQTDINKTQSQINPILYNYMKTNEHKFMPLMNSVQVRDVTHELLPLAHSKKVYNVIKLDPTDSSESLYESVRRLMDKLVTLYDAILINISDCFGDAYRRLALVTKESGDLLKYYADTQRMICEMDIKLEYIEKFDIEHLVDQKVSVTTFAPISNWENYSKYEISFDPNTADVENHYVVCSNRGYDTQTYKHDQDVLWIQTYKGRILDYKLTTSLEYGIKMVRGKSDDHKAILYLQGGHTFHFVTRHPKSKLIYKSVTHRNDLVNGKGEMWSHQLMDSVNTFDTTNIALKGADGKYYTMSVV